MYQGGPSLSKEKIIGAPRAFAPEALNIFSLTRPKIVYLVPSYLILLMVRFLNQDLIYTY